MKKIIIAVVITIIAIIAAVAAVFCSHIDGYQKANLVEIQFDKVFVGENAHSVWRTDDGKTIVVLHSGSGIEAGRQCQKTAQKWAGTGVFSYISCHSATHEQSDMIKAFNPVEGLSWHCPVPGGFIYGSFDASYVDPYRDFMDSIYDGRIHCRYYSITFLKHLGVKHQDAKKIVKELGI